MSSDGFVLCRMRGCMHTVLPICENHGVPSAGDFAERAMGAEAEVKALNLRITAMQEALDGLSYSEWHGVIAFPPRDVVAPLWSPERRKKEGL